MLFIVSVVVVFFDVVDVLEYISLYSVGFFMLNVIVV